MAKQEKSYGYGKRPMWQWVVIYIVIGGLIYAAFYYFILSKNSGYNPGSPTQTAPYNYGK